MRMIKYFNYAAGAGNADTVDGLHAGAFMPAGADLWVNTTGDAMSGRNSRSLGGRRKTEMLKAVGNTRRADVFVPWDDITKCILGYTKRFKANCQFASIFDRN